MMKDESAMKPTAVSPAPVQPTMREIPGLSPEVRAQLDEFSRNLGEALVANLNRPDPDKPAP